MKIDSQFTLSEKFTKSTEHLKELAILTIFHMTDVLAFIRDYQTKNQNPDNEGATKEEIARYMNEAGFSSRPTTLKTIQRLLDFGMIVDNKKRNNTFSRLIINPKYDFKQLVASLLMANILQVHERCNPFNKEARGANTVLVQKLLETIDSFMKIENPSNSNDILIPKPLDQYPTDDVYAPKQLQKMALDQQKKANNQLKKKLFGSVRKARNKTGID